MTDREIMQQSLEAFEDIANETYDSWTNGAKAQRIAQGLIPTIKEALNIAGQCRATASSPLAKNILVDGGSGLLTELLLDAARIIEALAQPEQEPVALVIDGVLVKSELPEKYTGHLYTAPPQRKPLTDAEKAVLRECREQAMKWTVQGRIPECGAFGEIAQDLDWLCDQLAAHGIKENT